MKLLPQRSCVPKSVKKGDKKLPLHLICPAGSAETPVEHFERWEDRALEVASTEGIIADGIPHLHTVVSDNQKACASHLEEGCIILYLGKIVIQSKRA